MSNSEVGWQFPPTGGGIAHGYNDPGIAHFGGAREQSLARETIQNSLDAAASLGNPVHVEFDVRTPGDDWFAKKGLLEAIGRCTKHAGASGDEKALRAFHEANQLLASQSTTFLRVADRNTTGLRGDKWEALLKRPGASVHDAPGAGGSWGIGKNAPFTLSPLRTVFYWTRFEEDGVPTERFQGKAVLMAHEVDGEERQNTGFYGLVDGCLALTGEGIPSAVRSVETGAGPRSGTSLWIAGFEGQTGWQERIARRVVASFFGAIADQLLTVTIEPSQSMGEQDLIDITGENIGKVSSDEDDDIEDARRFWELLQAEPTASRQDHDLGHCRLWIRVSDNEELPNTVGLMRKTGMLITTSQRGLIRFRGMRDFIAICRFEGDDGNELLRQMENPRHDQFEPDHIENDTKERRRGRAALKRTTDWIREEIRKAAAPTISMETSRLSELDRLLPDVDPEEPFGDDGGDGEEREPSFGTAPVVKVKPRRRPRAPVLPDADDDDEGPDDDTEVSDNGGGSGGGRDTPVFPSTKRRRLAIGDVRLVPVGGSDSRYRVSFHADEAGVADIVLAEAGDSTLVIRKDVRAWSPDGSALSLKAMELAGVEHVEFEISADAPIEGRAWIVAAVSTEPS